MSYTGFIDHAMYDLHVQSQGHPECPERLESIRLELQARNLMNKLNKLQIEPLSIEHLLRVHAQDYIDTVIKISERGGGLLDDGDTVACKFSYQAANLAASGVIQASNAIMQKSIKNAFCAVRPPGHHALSYRAMGFCIFNNISLVARYLQEKYSIKKILIIDFDVHHGNGTQDIFYDDSSVYFFSTHQYPFYPGTGSADEIGRGAGEGFTMNVPLEAYSGGNKILEALEGPLYSAMQIYKPEFILLSSGYDAFHLDPVGGLQVKRDEFRQINKVALKMAHEFCQGRLISVLEGGYNTEILGKLVADQVEDFLQ